MNIEIRIKVRGRWYKAKKTGKDFDYPCDKCRFKRTCWNDESMIGYEIKHVCSIFGYGFKEVKDK